MPQRSLVAWVPPSAALGRRCSITIVCLTEKLELLNLDDEALKLVQDIPGALKLVVRDAETTYTASLGPGSRAIAPPACALSCSLADAELLRTGKVQPMELFFGGRIQIEGDPQVAIGLAGLFM